MLLQLSGLPGLRLRPEAWATGQRLLVQGTYAVHDFTSAVYHQCVSMSLDVNKFCLQLLSRGVYCTEDSIFCPAMSSFYWSGYQLIGHVLVQLA